MANNVVEILIRGNDQSAAGIASAVKNMGSLGSALGAIRSSLAGIVSTGALVALAKSAIELGSNLSDMSKKFGVSAEQLSQLQYGAKMVGVELESLGQGFKFLSKSISEAQDPTSQTATAFRLLGVNTKNANGTLKDTNQVFDEVADAFSKLEDGANKTALAIAIFGRSGADMLPMFEKGAEGIRSMKAEAVAMGLALSDAEIKKLDEYGDAIDRIGLKAKTAAGRLAIFVAEMMTSASGGMEGVAGYIPEAGPAEGNVGEDVYAGGAYKRPAKSIAEEEARRKASAKAAEDRAKADEALLKAGEKGWVAYADAIKEIDFELYKSLSEINKAYWTDKDKEDQDGVARNAEYIGATVQAIVDAQFDAAVAASEATKRIFKDADDSNKEIKDFVVNGFNDMADALATFVTTGKLNFKDFVNSVLADLTRLLVKMTMYKTLEGFGLGSWLGLPAATPKAMGGPVSAGGMYLVGERGPELFSPSTSGSIIPNGGGSVTVNIANNTGQPVSAKASSKIDLKGAVVNIVLEAIEYNRGGLRTALGRG